MKKLLVVLLIFLYIPINAQPGWNWLKPLPQGNHLNDIHVFDTNTAIIAGDYGTFMKTSNGGDTWEIQSCILNIEKPIQALDFIDSNTGWAVGGDWDEGFVLKTVDRGDSWTCIHTTDFEIYRISFIDANHGWALADDWDCFVYYTNDGGQTWDEQSVDFDDDLEDIWFENENEGWVVGSGWTESTLFYTTDGGDNWMQHDVEMEGGMLSIFFLDDQKGWIAGEDGTVYKTTNGGDDWDLVAEVDIFDFNSIWFVDANTGWAASGFGFIYYTTDGGTTWDRYDDESDCDFSSLVFSDSEHGWVIGNGGIVLRTEDGGQTWDPKAGSTASWIQTVWFLDENTGFIAVLESKNKKWITKIYKTINSGEEWFLVNEFSETILNLEPINDEIWGSGHNVIIRNIDKQNWNYEFKDTSRRTGQIRDITYNSKSVL